MLSFAEVITRYIIVIFGGNASKVEEIANLIAKAPETFFVGDFWDKLLRIGSMAFMPLALAILGFFAASEFYEMYCKANGEIDVQLVSSTVFRFVIPFFMVTHSYDIIKIIFDIFNGVLMQLSKAFTVTLMPTPVDYQKMLDAVNKMNLFEQMNVVSQLILPYMAMTVMGGVVWVIVYGRAIEIMLLWLVAPIPIAAIPSQEFGQMAKGFLKTFAALMLQGVLMLLCVVIYGAISWSMVDPSNIDIYTTWNLIWPMAILIFTLTKTGGLAKRICGTF